MVLLNKKVRISKIFEIIEVKKKLKKNFFIKKISNIKNSSNGDLTICNNIKYLGFLKKTRASACLVSPALSKYVPKTCLPIISANIDADFTKIGNIFYKNYLIDKVSDKFLNKKQIKKKYKNINIGENFICESKVKIGKNSAIGHNVIIKENCTIGKNVNIGSNVVISNSIIGNNVNIGDGSVIGSKGFGFKFYNNKLLRIPHIGKVILDDYVELGSNCTIDRGSISDTKIGKNTFLDNQVHIAHNNKIGNNCIIAGQVGFAGSSTLGDNIMIGGQAGISGHLKIGNNVHIGGGSGVLNNISDNTKVMGYPAKNLRQFLKNNR